MLLDFLHQAVHDDTAARALDHADRDGLLQRIGKVREELAMVWNGLPATAEADTDVGLSDQSGVGATVAAGAELGRNDVHRSDYDQPVRYAVQAMAAWAARAC